MAISGSVRRRRLLKDHFLPSRHANLLAAKVAKNIGNPQLATRLERGGRVLDREVRIDEWGNVVRLGLSALGIHRLQKEWMYRSALRYDLGVAKHSADFARILVGMPASCRYTFEAACNSYRVLHQVNAHPEYHNEILNHHFGRKATVEEQLPRAAVRRIIDEADAADAILVPSELVRRQYLSAGYPECRLLKVPYGVDFDDFRPAEVDTGLNRRRPILLFVGQIGFRKGLPFLLAAVRDLPLDLHLIGPLVSKEVIRSVPSNVEYMGSQLRPRVIEAMQKADGFVLPSIEDSFALVIAEAASCGLPVITTSSTGGSELLRPEDAVVVEAGDVGALRNALAGIGLLTREARHERHARIISDSIFRSWSAYGDLVSDTLVARSKSA